MQVLRLLFAQRIANFQGRHFRLNDARCNPKPLQKHLRGFVFASEKSEQLLPRPRLPDRGR